MWDKPTACTAVLVYSDFSYEKSFQKLHVTQIQVCKIHKTKVKAYLNYKSSCATKVYTSSLKFKT